MQQSVNELAKLVSHAETVPPAAAASPYPPADVEQKVVTPRPVYVTAQGLDRLQAQVGILIAEIRPELIARIRPASELGAPEHAELGVIREDLTIVEGLILHLHNLIRDSVVIDTNNWEDQK